MYSRLQKIIFKVSLKIKSISLIVSSFSFPLNVKNISNTLSCGFVVHVDVMITTTITITIVRPSFPTPLEEKEEKVKKEVINETFIPPHSTTSTAMTQSRADRKRAFTMKALETEKASKRDTGQDRGRGRGGAGTGAKG